MERIGKGLPSGNLLQFAIENGPVEIVDLPIKNGWVFHSFLLTFTWPGIDSVPKPTWFESNPASPGPGGHRFSAHVRIR